MATLAIKQVVKAYDAHPILKGIDLDIQDGELIILVGPSGCGKSTLMNCIAGLEGINEGSIYIDERDVTQVAPKNRDIAMVFQSYALYPNMTVRKNIEFALEIRKIPKAQRKEEVERVAKLLQIEALLDRKPAALSGGQRQRVAMGRALARQPKVYLFDEPLSNLDAKLRVEMRTEIKKLHQSLGTTIVYVTHDQIEAMTLADRIAVMSGGEVQQFASPQEIYDNPVNLFVAGFMGSPAMNFVRCTVQQEDQGPYVVLATPLAQCKVALPDNPALQAYVGKEVILGLRPEKLTQVVPHQQSQPGFYTLTSRVEVTEPTGSDTLVMVTLNGQPVQCRVAPSAAKGPGLAMELMINMQAAVLFDPDTELRI